MQIDDLLITESQLSSRLNQSVQQHRRGEFALLLAMLSHDALDFSQFHLPKTELRDKLESEESLRKQFELGPQQQLAPDEFDMLIGQFNASAIANLGERAGMADIKLNHCLHPEPLAIRDEPQHIPLNVVDNCELAVRRRIAKQHTQLAPPQMDAAGFYASLNNAELHRPLHVVSA
jgi:hypothetical protein